MHVADVGGLHHYLTEQWRNISRRKATELEQRRDTAWEKKRAARFTDLPENIQT
jgi:hypothetical protein